MKYKVVSAFKDKRNNLRLYRKGDSFKSTDEKRVAFLMDKGFIEEKSKQPPKSPKKKSEK